MYMHIYKCLVHTVNAMCRSGEFTDRVARFVHLFIYVCLPNPRQIPKLKIYHSHI